MIYRMSKKMFAEISGTKHKAKPTSENMERVISYINQTFGLNRQITELRLI